MGYDKLLILKAMKEIEAGLLHKKANRIFGLGKNTQQGWMQDYKVKDYIMVGIIPFPEKHCNWFVAVFLF